jgi:hypothetical protein
MKHHWIAGMTLLASWATASAGVDLKADFQTSAQQVKQAQQQAASVGGEWRDSGKLMKKAREAAAQGDYAKAITLAERVRQQYQLGYQQAASQRNRDLTPAYLK